MKSERKSVVPSGTSSQSAYSLAKQRLERPDPVKERTVTKAGERQPRAIWCYVTQHLGMMGMAVAPARLTLDGGYERRREER